jgi:ketosteroid isomerase-like protein
MTGSARQDIERIYRAWDEALGKKDLEGALSLYGEDASIESPLVQHLLKQRRGIVRGKDNLRTFIARCSRPTRRSASASSRASSPTAGC